MSSKVATDGPFEAVLGKTHRTEFSRGKGKPEARSSPPGAPSLLGSSSFLPEKMNRHRITRDTGLRADLLNGGDVPRGHLPEIRCQFIILARKDEPTPDYAQEFAVSLDELHNDSTTVSFYGAYDEAGQESEQRGRPTHAITWGHSKARRPDLKQLLYILTVTSDGNVPVFFSTASGNTVDDRTHIGTWDLLYELIGHADFLYVADCKLASSENLSHIATRGGRFVTVLYALTNDQGHIVDELFVCGDDHVHSEGYRLFWYRSTCKAEQDKSRRARRSRRRPKR